MTSNIHPESTINPHGKVTTKLRDVTKQKIRVRVYTTDHWEIQGDILLPSSGYNARLSDFLNNDNTFIALTNAQVYDIDGKLLASESFLSVNKRTIKVVIEDQKSEVSLVAEAGIV